ncbi:MAG: hypothetical protein QOD99_533, partial [Chthoniobacter sp.]|nr:hypothetical protein [Chthoniobacter sp.]
MGEVWCVTLWDARANLINKYGFAIGNQLILQLVTDGMKLSPANPNFLQARDAILQADLVDNGGANRGELWSAFAKHGMGAGATAPASSTTVGLVEAYDIPDPLGVSPNTALNATGMVGGPFTPATTGYTLINSGSSALNWTASNTQPWLTVSPSSGTLAASGTVTVTATLNAAVNALTTGTYSDTITFRNLTSNLAQQRSAQALVDPVTIPVFSENFESGSLNPAFWTSTGTSTFRTLVTTANTPHAGSYHLTMDSSADGTYERNEVTLALDLTGKQNLTLKFWACGYSDESDGPPASPFTNGADFDGVAISRDGVTWHEVQGLRGLTTSYQQFVVDLDAAIGAHGWTYNSTFKIRFNHYDNYGISTDGIAIDDISIVGTVANRITVTAPATTTEGGPELTGTVSVVPTPSADLNVALASSDTGALTVPATVTIPAGQTSATIPITVLDDTALNGSRIVTVSGSASGYGPGAASITVNDNETAALSLAVPASATEGDGTAQGTVTLSAAPASNVAVSLLSSDTTAAIVPATVVLSAGKTSTTFPITIVNDNKIDGAQWATLTAHVANWTDGLASITVLDDETKNLTLIVPASAREGDGTKTGTVSLAGTLTSDFVASLSSNDTSEVTVPASVTIPAGQISANFSLNIIDDSVTDGSQSATIAASAAGFTGASASITVADNDADHFGFATISSPQVRNAPFTVSVIAHDQSNAVITNYSSALVFSGSSSAGAAPVTSGSGGGFVNGVWTGTVKVDASDASVVLTASDGNGHSGTSNTFGVGTGALDHFAWSAIASPQTADNPFVATLTAVDVGGNPVAFTGTANFAATVSGSNALIASGSATWSYPLYTFYHDARTQVIYLASEIGRAGRINALALNVSTLPGQTMNNFTIRMKHASQSSVSSAWDNTGWMQVYRANQTVSATGWVTFTFTTPFEYDGTSNLMVDFSFDNSSYTSAGNCVATIASAYRSLDGYSDSGYGDPLTWSGSSPSPSLSTYVPNVQLSFGARSAPITPASASGFVGGIWNGIINMPFAASNVSIVASDAAAHSGQSNSFNVALPVTTGTNAPNAIAVNIPSQISEGASVVSGTVTLPSVASADVAVSLSANAPAKISVPANVTIHAGQSSAGFSFNAPDDAVLDGDKTVSITASASGFITGSTTIKVLDNETASLTLSVPSSTTEGAGSVTGTVTLSTVSSGALQVNLLSSDTTAVIVPATVTFQPGQSSAAFSITVVDDTKIDGTQTATITASSGTWTPASATISVADNENTNLTLSVPTPATEGNGQVTGTVYINGTLPTDLVVALASSDTTEVTVPSTVTIPAGMISATFWITPVDDTISDGTQTATITASANGFTSATATMTIYDNELDHYSISTIASPQVRNAPFYVVISAKDISNVSIANFTGALTLTASGASGSVPITPATVTLYSGTWSGNVTIGAFDSSLKITAADSTGRSATSNSFVVGIGALHHFGLSSVASPQGASVGFPLMITAQDTGNNTVLGYTGTVSLSASTPMSPVTTGSGTATWPNPLYAASPTSRTQVIYPASELGGAARLTGLSLYLSSFYSSLSSSFAIRIKTTTLSSYSSAAWDTTGWTTVYQQSTAFNAPGWVTFTFSTPFDYDGKSNLIVDFTLTNTSPRSPTYVRYTSRTGSRTLYANADYPNPLAWGQSGVSSPIPALSSIVPNIQFTEEKVLSVSPVTTGSFAGGLSNGGVSIATTSTGTKITASDTSSHKGTSNT